MRFDYYLAIYCCFDDFKNFVIFVSDKFFVGFIVNPRFRHTVTTRR